MILGISLECARHPNICHKTGHYGPRDSLGVGRSANRQHPFTVSALVSVESKTGDDKPVTQLFVLTAQSEPNRLDRFPACQTEINDSYRFTCRTDFGNAPTQLQALMEMAFHPRFACFENCFYNQNLCLKSSTVPKRATDIRRHAGIGITLALYTWTRPQLEIGHD